MNEALIGSILIAIVLIVILMILVSCIKIVPRPQPWLWSVWAATNVPGP